MTGPRFAVLAPAGRLPRWQSACVAALREEGATCVAVLCTPAEPPGPGVAMRAYARALGLGTRALVADDPAPGLPHLPPARWREAGPLDLVLSFAAAEAPVARLGVWQLRLGGRAAWEAAVPLLAETAAALPAFTVEVVTSAGPRLLESARLPMRRSHARTLDALAEAAPALCRGALRRVRASVMPAAATPAPVAAPQAGVARALLGQARAVGARVARLGWRDEWRVGVVATTPEAVLAGARLPMPRWLDMPAPGRFHADPFPLQAEGRPWLIFEMYDHARGRGWIAAAPRDAPGGLDAATTAIDLGCHMSYPATFAFEGATWCAPEAAGAGGLRLFRMGATPDRWEQVAHLLPGLRLADPTIFPHAGRWWLFATPDGAEVGTALHLWHAPSPLGPWTAHPLNPVKRDVASARPAGQVFAHGDALYRPGQDGAGAYGRAVVLHRILRLDPEGFEEVAVARLEPGRDWPCPDGLHTVNWQDGALVLDALRHVPRWRRRKGTPRPGR